MKKKIILYGLMILAIVLGVVVITLKGFNYDITCSNHKRLEITLDKEHNISDVKSIVKETIKNKTVVKQTTLFNTSFSIEAIDITDEEINNLLGKLNEKYQTDFNIKQMKKEDILDELDVDSSIDSMEDKEVSELIEKIKNQYGLEYTKEELQNTDVSLKLSNVAKTSFLDFTKSLIMPALLSLVIIAVYYSIRFKKLYKLAWLCEPAKLIFEMILVQAFIIAVVGLVRIPINSYINIVLIFIWMIQLILKTIISEKQLSKV